MKNLIEKLTIICILVFGYSLSAQSNDGINYKAIVKNDLGNVVANQLIQVEVQIMKGQGMELTYHEEHAITTNTNGLIVLIIGEGTSLDGEVESLSDVEWDDDVYFYKVLINIGNGLVDMGTDLFRSVPYAIHSEKADIAETALNVTGLEAIDEGNGLGWRLKGKDSNNYGTIGLDAVDLSSSPSASISIGATGENATAMGFRTTASGYASTAMGFNTTASREFSFALGDNATASGYGSIAMGGSSIASADFSTAIGVSADALGNYSFAIGNSTTASGESSIAMGGFTIAPSYLETTLGSFNTEYVPNDTQNWNENDRLFVIGNGTSFGRSNALAIFKNGIITAPSFDLAEITDDKSLVTKEYVDLNIESHNHLGETWSGYDNLTINTDLSSDGALNVINTSPSGSGIIVTADIYGIIVHDTENNGIDVGASERNGGSFKGALSGVYAESTNNANPDVILGGRSNTSAGDDGIIASDPEYLGSDIFIRSNDAVVVQLDFDNDETGQFEIKAGDGSEIFEVDETGTIRQNGATIHSSDRRLKKEIETLKYGLKEVLKLEPKAYFWKDRKGQFKSLGLIAQDVQSIIKEIVTAQDNEEKILGISYTELIPILINAIKEQQDIINNQNLKINDLSAELDSTKSLELRVQKIEVLLNTPKQ
ncbi:tail fiber domain-containing protein [uncultured Psychroserpens sp.]|uniref:tail fiber domain-containing protein n=1 Tax=uncultured Psychroserpens sp. TaxID=255436 RepID=UPI00260C4A27|nr:tail fiber domain-containing protein [uncultured Psychroserpens sp.]